MRGLITIIGAAPGANTAANCGRDYLGRAYTCNYLFQPGGSLVRQTGTRAGIAAAALTNTPGGSNL